MHSATGKRLLGTCLLFLCSASFGNVITFNSLPNNGSAVPNGYGGLGWNNFAAMTMPLPPATTAFTFAPSSGSVAFNRGAGPASFSSSSTFTFTSAMFSTMGPGSIGLEVLGT